MHVSVNTSKATLQALQPSFKRGLVDDLQPVKSEKKNQSIRTQKSAINTCLCDVIGLCVVHIMLYTMGVRLYNEIVKYTYNCSRLFHSVKSFFFFRFQHYWQEEEVTKFASNFVFSGLGYLMTVSKKTSIQESQN